MIVWNMNMALWMALAVALPNLSRGVRAQDGATAVAGEAAADSNTPSACAKDTAKVTQVLPDSVSKKRAEAIREMQLIDLARSLDSEKKIDTMKSLSGAEKTYVKKLYRLLHP